jgi:hypothetical protein
VSTINDHSPSWCTAVTIALDAVPEIMKRLRQVSDRSAAISKARDLFVNEGDTAAASEILADLVAKSGGPLGRNSNEVVSPQKAVPDRAQLLAKRDALVAFRDRLRPCRGKDIGKANPLTNSSEGAPTAIKLPPSVTAHAAAVRLSKSELQRKATLAHRLELLRGQFQSGRNWQPLRKAALAMRINQLREGVYS